MRQETRMRAQLAAMVFLMTNAVVFGAGLVTVLSVPELNGNAGLWIAVVVVASFVLSAPISWAIAPRLRLRYWKQRAAEHPRAAASQHG